MALHLGARALDAQEFGRQREARAVVEGDVQRLLAALEADFSARGRNASVVELAGLVGQHDRDAVADRIGKPGARG